MLPFPTEMIGAFGDDRFTELFYIGTIFASSLCQTTIALLVRRDPSLAKYPGGITDAWRLNAVGSTFALAAAFGVSALVPGVDYYSLLLLVVPPWIARTRYRGQVQDGD